MRLAAAGRVQYNRGVRRLLLLLLLVLVAGAAAPDAAAAHPRRLAIEGRHAHPRHRVVVGPRHHRRHFSSFGFGFHFGYPYYGYPYYGYPYYGYPAYVPWAPYPYYPSWVAVPVAPPNVGFVDLKVEPEEAEVWIGGEAVGIADDFDGFPDLLALRAGRRTITLRHPGYRDLRLRLDVVPGAEIRVRRRMVPLPPAAP